MITDERLIKGLLKRDQKALEEIYDRYHLLLWKIASEAESDQRVCEQLITQVFTHIWNNSHEFTGNKRLALLLIECCRTKIKERARQNTAWLNTMEPQVCCG